MQAQLWKPDDSGEQKIHCLLCAHGCHITHGKRGLCGVRENTAGILSTLVGDGIAAFHPDPVEKKPLYHYRPGSSTFSIGTEGCTFRCRFCQNADLAMSPGKTGKVRFQPATPEQIVAAAKQTSCTSVAFTYNEPTVFYELMTATADLALASGLGTIMVSNGFQSQDCLKGLEHRIQAANIDLKSFSDTFYRTLCGGRLAPVLDNLKTMRQMGWWVEVTTLIIPGWNDEPQEWRDIARFIRQELGPEVPWHVSAFRPCHQMADCSPTSVQTIERACEIGIEEGLFFVYPGNVPVDRDTRCPGCGSIVLKRRGWSVIPEDTFKDGVCTACGMVMPGRWL